MKTVSVWKLFGTVDIHFLIYIENFSNFRFSFNSTLELASKFPFMLKTLILSYFPLRSLPTNLILFSHLPSLL